MKTAISSLDVALYFHLEEGREQRGWRNFNCPFCGEKKHKMGINIEKGGFSCYHCGSHGTPLSLYAFLKHGDSDISNLSSEEKKKFLREMEADLGQSDYGINSTSSIVHPESQEIRPKPDKDLSEMYRQILSLPLFALSKEHFQNLKKRGLSDRAIKRNRYRSCSITRVREVVKQDAALRQYLVYCKKTPGFLKNVWKNRHMPSMREMLADIAVGWYITQHGIPLDGVPGAYMVDQSHWAFRSPPGMLIPTRNIKGEIVCLQVRSDRSGEGVLRYMTISGRGLPKGVTENLSRLHYPLANARPLTPATTFVITEGPLKADIALDLMREQGRTDVAFVAVQGVSHVSKLVDETFPALTAAGINTIHNAFDMDKVVNPGVMIACKRLHKLAAKANLHVEHCYWGKHDAQVKYRELCACASANNIEIPAQSATVFLSVAKLAKLLHENGVVFCRKTVNGKSVKDYWPASTKGIDDWLLERSKKMKESA